MQKSVLWEGECLQQELEAEVHFPLLQATCPSLSAGEEQGVRSRASRQEEAFSTAPKETFFSQLAESHCGTWAKEVLIIFVKTRFAKLREPQPALSVLQMASFCILNDSF